MYALKSNHAGVILGNILSFHTYTLARFFPHAPDEEQQNPDWFACEGSRACRYVSRVLT